MQGLEYSKRRLRAFLAQLRQLKGAEFPYGHVQDGLTAIEGRFSQLLSDLEMLNASNAASVVTQMCTATIAQLDTYLPLLGFFARSTDTRNAFEVYAPLLRISRLLLGSDAKLVLSSEWRFSPYTFKYGVIQDLEKFVMIGLPAPEAANVLLLPLAGHELGHSVWRHQNIDATFVAAVQNHVLTAIKSKWSEWQKLRPSAVLITGSPDLFTLAAIGQAQTWAIRQVEEMFCDLFGLALFGQSYLYASAYLIAPGGLSRVYSYPTMPRRVAALQNYANQLAVPVPAGFSTWFSPETGAPKADSEPGFLLSLADVAADSSLNNLMAAVNTQIATSHVVRYSSSEQARIVKQFKLLVPAADTKSLADILNATWEVSNDSGFCPTGHPLSGVRDSFLLELSLKTIEVQEIETRLR